MKQQKGIYKNLLDVVDNIAEKKYSGHFCIFSFTTSYKGCFNTIPDYCFREVLSLLPSYKSVKELLTEMTSFPENFDAFTISDLVSHYNNSAIEIKELEVGRKFVYKPFTGLTPAYQVIKKFDDDIIQVENITEKNIFLEYANCDVIPI